MPKVLYVRAGVIFGLVGSDQLFVTLNASYPKMWNGDWITSSPSDSSIPIPTELT